MKTLEQLGISPAPWKAVQGISLWVESSDGICVADDIDMIDDETGEANARLIAAAPDLYEALRLWVEELCEDCQSEIGKTCDGKCEAVRKAKAALAKAGGEE